ncbi:MAG: hypothetical protein IKY14_03985, partial [Erysipelotrichaceae bacterium]|nr:hypothetical protein [Erysipelotrichaceae bacterium]
MSDYQRKLKRHMHFQFNMVGIAFLCLSLIGTAGYFLKDALWSYYESVITIFAYGFVDNLYEIMIKFVQSVVPFFL